MNSMSSETELAAAADLQPEQVADYLRQHPDFFERHAELLSELMIPHRSGTTSLIERQVIQLRNENGQLKKRLASLISNAETNDELLEKTRRLILRLLKADIPAKLTEELEHSLCHDLGADQCRVWTIDSFRMAGCNSISSEQAALELSRLIIPHQPHCGLLKTEETELLFPGQTENVGSALIIPLFMPSKEAAKHGSLVAILAIGNKNKDYYRDNMSTSLLAYLSDVYLQLLLKANKAQQPQSV